LATKKQKAAKQDMKDKVTNERIKQPIEEVKELDDKTKGRDTKRKKK
jgi:hypothetical protein